MVHARSEWLALARRRDGHVPTSRYQRGVPTSPVHKAGTTRRVGTTVTFQPDPEICTETTEVRFETLSARLRALAFFIRDLHITIEDERDGRAHECHDEGGIESCVAYLNRRSCQVHWQRTEPDG